MFWGMWLLAFQLCLFVFTKKIIEKTILSSTTTLNCSNKVIFGIRVRMYSEKLKYSGKLSPFYRQPYEQI